MREILFKAKERHTHKWLKAFMLADKKPPMRLQKIIRETQ